MTISTFQRNRSFPLIVLTIAVAMMFPASRLRADQPSADAVGRTPPRLSFFEGDVSFWRPGADDWSEAQINTPLAPGDQLYTGAASKLELQIGPRAYVRAAEDSQLGLENQEPDFLQMRVASGDVAIDVRSLAAGHTLEIDTPQAAFTIEQTGYYRARVNEQSTTFIVRRGGSADMTLSGSDHGRIESGQQSVIRDSEGPSVETAAAPDLDQWDGWNYGRTDRLLASGSSNYVPEEVYGEEDLESSGSWRVEPTYGPVWVPAGVPPNWAPYTVGRWIWDPYYGWTWLSGFSWGWAPFHYGRWVYLNDCWGWAPGPRVYAPAYAPALVAFFGGGVGVSVGIGAPVGWVSLSWGEPLYPWWGGGGFYHRPWWGGWGGPRVVINKTKIVNKTKIIHVDGYRNARHRNGVVVVRGDRFGRGDVRTGRIDKYDRDHLRAIRGGRAPRPTAESLRLRDERGRRPPSKVLDRPVVATHAPRDTSRRLRAAGLKPATNRADRVRLVESPRQRRLASASVPRLPQERAIRQPRSPQGGARGQSAAVPRSRIEPPAQRAPDPRASNLRRSRPNPATQPRVAPAAPRSLGAQPLRREGSRTTAPPPQRSRSEQTQRNRPQRYSAPPRPSSRSGLAPQRVPQRSQAPVAAPRHAPERLQSLDAPPSRPQRSSRDQQAARPDVRRQSGDQRQATRSMRDQSQPRRSMPEAGTARSDRRQSRGRRDNK